MDKVNIVRLKINRKNIIKISRTKNGDYIFSIPLAVINNVQLEQHFTFHIKNNRITFKITKIKCEKKKMSDYLAEARERNFYVTNRDIDLYNERHIKDCNIEKNMAYLFSFGYKDLKDDYLEKIIKKSKTEDNKFQEIFSCSIPQKYNTAKVDIYLNKGLPKNDILSIIEEQKNNLLYGSIVEKHVATDNLYNFIIICNYYNKII